MTGTEPTYPRRAADHAALDEPSVEPIPRDRRRSEGDVAESGTRRQVLAARQHTEAGWGVVVVALVAAAFVAGWRSRRRWGRLMGW
jgi:hypothetical protein